VVDPMSGEVKMRKNHDYPNHSGVLTTAGGIVFTALLDGTVIAYDDRPWTNSGNTIPAPASSPRR
jgi:alcohol dehydrogenase (cytochrome c)